MAGLDDNGARAISPPWMVALHLAPGLAFGGLFFVLSRWFLQHGLTGYLALLVTIPVCLVPIEIGVMLLWGSRYPRRRSLADAIEYRHRGSATDYVLWPALILLWLGVSSLLLAPATRYVGTHLSGWLPPWTTQDAILAGVAGLGSLERAITLGAAVVLSGFVAPIVEEMYFRGFLLPRMGRLGWAAPAVNSLLFAVYHFYFLANVPVIFLAFLPIAYLARAKANWRIGAVTHSLINLFGVLQVARLMT